MDFLAHSAGSRNQTMDKHWRKNFNKIGENYRKPILWSIVVVYITWIVIDKLNMRFLECVISWTKDFLEFKKVMMSHVKVR